MVGVARASGAGGIPGRHRRRAVDAGAGLSPPAEMAKRHLVALLARAGARQCTCAADADIRPRARDDEPRVAPDGKRSARPASRPMGWLVAVSGTVPRPQTLLPHVLRSA